MSDIPTELLLPPPKTADQRDLYNALNELIRKIADALNDNIILPSGGSYYLGGREDEGAWRIHISGTDLQLQRLESSTWITKNTISA